MSRLKPTATAALAVFPAAVTDRTCAAVLGLEPRVFRELVDREKVRHVRLGRRVLVQLTDFLAALDKLAVEPQPPTVHLPEDDDQPKSVEDVLARLGRELTPEGKASLAKNRSCSSKTGFDIIAELVQGVSKK